MICKVQNNSLDMIIIWALITWWGVSKVAVTQSKWEMSENQRIIIPQTKFLTHMLNSLDRRRTLTLQKVFPILSLRITCRMWLKRYKSFLLFSLKMEILNKFRIWFRESKMNRKSMIKSKKRILNLDLSN